MKALRRRLWPRRTAGKGVALIAAAVLAVGFGCNSTGRGEGDARQEDQPPTAATASTTEPIVGAAPATGTAPATRKWTPPRFTTEQKPRDAMVQDIRDYGLTDQAILDAMSRVPRHEFVPEARRRAAYADTPLPIGYGQTISQPYIVAEMTRQLALKSGAKVLEIGTGSGYQAAVLTEFTPHVYTIEIVKPLADAAAATLKRLGYDTVQVRHGDGYYGWEEHAPFDAIIVTAAAGQIPPPLLKQLAPGGRMVIPVGGVLSTQSLMLVEKKADGSVASRSLLPVQFVPFTRKDTSKEE